MAFTDAQKRAIEAGTGNLLLSAAAGSGKTHTLVARILQLLDMGANVDEMLIITFTRAAAAEMRQRLIRELSERGEANPRLLNQLRRAEYASIETIDAFCSEVVKSHFEAADADPQFRVADKTELRQLAQKALDAALEECYKETSDGLRALHFGRGVKQVSELVLTLYAFAENRPDPLPWLCQALTEMPTTAPALWFEELRKAVARELPELLSQANHILDLCNQHDGPAYYTPAVQDDIRLLCTMREADYDQLQSLIKTRKHKTLARKPKDLTSREELFREQVVELRKKLKRRLDSLGKLPRREDALSDLVQNQPALEQLYQLTLSFARHFDAGKAEKSVFSFSDIAHRALRALSDPEVAASVRRRFSHVFVDEYQDVSELQEALLQKVVREDNAFFVGDVKQSIYRFRQADPSLFLEKYARYGRGKDGELIPLSQNFRSRAGVLEFTNAVFERVMAGESAEVQYDRNQRLVPGMAFEGEDPPVELLIISEPGKNAPSEDLPDLREPEEEALNGTEREGALIAMRIREIMKNEQYYDAKDRKWRAFRHSDFAVLLRSRTAMAEIEAQLTRAGLPVYADYNKGYLDALEVKMLLALLQLIENRRRDKELLIVLKSPIVGLTNTELAQIRAIHPSKSYRDACLAYMALSDALAQRLKAFETQLDRWRLLSRSLPLSMLIDTILRESRFYALAGAMPFGEMRQANLDLMLTYAAEFDETQGGALTGFLRYMKKAERSDDSMGVAHTLGEGDDVVLLITAHKSKGLEYPVVFAPQMARMISTSKKRGELLLHRSLGVGLALNDLALGSRRETLPWLAIRARLRHEELSEEMRILYVLMTRAIDRLVLIGTSKNFTADALNWTFMPQEIPSPGRYLDALAAVVLSAPGGDALLNESGEALVTCCGAKVLARHYPANTLPSLESMAGDAPPAEPKDAIHKERIQNALDWRYPYAEDVLLPLKLTASGLTRELIGPTASTELTRRPKFLSGAGLSATERGTLMHLALMHLRFEPLRPLSGDALRAELDEQLRSMLIKGQLFDMPDPSLICNFLTGDVGRRLLHAKRVEREWAFNLRLPLRDALALESEQTVLVQGVIDCCFLEEDEWILLDYKTDRAHDLDRLIEHYRPQLLLYARALSEITGKKVKQRLLCLLGLGREIEL